MPRRIGKMDRILECLSEWPALLKATAEAADLRAANEQLTHEVTTLKKWLLERVKLYNAAVMRLGEMHMNVSTVDRERIAREELSKLMKRFEGQPDSTDTRLAAYQELWFFLNGKGARQC